MRTSSLVERRLDIRSGRQRFSIRSSNRERMHPPSALGALRGRLAPALILLALLALAVPAGAGAASASPVLTFKTMTIGAPGNPAVGIVPFSDAIYKYFGEA